MSKWWKITLYVILILAIIAVAWLMFWNTNPNVETPDYENTDTPIKEETVDTWNNTINYENTNTFEDDVMKDLEWFFWNNNGYEDIQWEFWFTSPENE